MTENLYIYEYLPGGKGQAEILVVDCGVGFPDMEMHGVDLVIPDFSYLKKNRDRIKGILLSQGHEDHQGALPFLLKEIKAPVYAPKLTAAFVKDNLEDQEVKGVDIKIYDPDRDVLTIGSFKITAFRVSHSIPDTLGFAIDTPEGQVFHVAESKFDPAPVAGTPFDIQKARALSSKGVLFLASDCLGSHRQGTTPPEAPIEERLEKVARQAKGAIFFTTISSNISRIQQAIRVAGKLKRKVSFIGFSIARKAELARQLGFLQYSNKEVIPPKRASNLNPQEVFYIIAGCYGQVGSSLFRVATGEHEKIVAEENDMVIFSSDPGPPYSKETIDFVVDALIDRGLDVHYYDLNEGLYVSGHGSREDILRLFEIVKPKYFIPVGGTIRYMRAYKKLAEEFSHSSGNVFELKAGEIVEFENGKGTKKGKVEARQVLVDGLGIGDVGEIILKDRKTLAESGVAVVIIKFDPTQNKVVGTPEIMSRGFVFERQEKEFIRQANEAIKKRLLEVKALDSRGVKYTTAEFLAEYFFNQTGRRPMILPVVIES